MNSSKYEVLKELNDEIATEIVVEDWVTGWFKGLTQEGFQFEFPSIVDEYILSGDVSWWFWEGFELPESIDGGIHDIPYLGLWKMLETPISGFNLIIKWKFIVFKIKLHAKAGTCIIELTYPPQLH